MKIVKEGRKNESGAYVPTYVNKLYRAQCPYCGCVFEFNNNEINNGNNYLYYYHIEESFYLRLTCPCCYFCQDIPTIRDIDPYYADADHEKRIIPLLRRDASSSSFDIICINEDLSDKKVGLTKKGDM